MRKGRNVAFWPEGEGNGCPLPRQVSGGLADVPTSAKARPAPMSLLCLSPPVLLLEPLQCRQIGPFSGGGAVMRHARLSKMAHGRWGPANAARRKIDSGWPTRGTECLVFSVKASPPHLSNWSERCELHS